MLGRSLGLFFFSSRRRHTRLQGDWSSDVCSSDLRQVPATLRALGRDDRIEMPDFATRALLTGDEIASMLGERPGPRIGQLKRALLEAQLRGEVRTREEAVKLLVASC